MFFVTIYNLLFIYMQTIRVIIPLRSARHVISEVGSSYRLHGMSQYRPQDDVANPCSL
jgi:hypothetical protein